MGIKKSMLLPAEGKEREWMLLGREGWRGAEEKKQQKGRGEGGGRIVQRIEGEEVEGKRWRGRSKNRRRKSRREEEEG